MKAAAAFFIIAAFLLTMANPELAVAEKKSTKSTKLVKSVINDGDDDVEVSEDSVKPKSTCFDMHGIDNKKPQSTYLRFTEVSLPSDAEITNAYIVFTSLDKSKGNTKLTISGELGEGNTLPETPDGYKKMKFTKSSKEMTTPDVQKDQLYKTENLSNVVKEMQKNNNKLQNYTFKIDGNQEGEFLMRSYDSNKAKAPQLVVVYRSAYKEFKTEIDYYKNDAEEYGPKKSMDYSSSVKIGGYRSSSMSASDKSRAAFRFPEVKIPTDAVIDDAYLELTTKKKTSANTTANMEIRVELGDEGRYRTDKGDISKRKYSTTFSPFKMKAIKETKEVFRTGNLAKVIAEAQQKGWKRGDSLNFLFDGDAYIGGVYEGDSSHSPRLVIRYKEKEDTPEPTEPTTKPTTEPTTEPTTKPTTEPTTKPTTEPTTKPTTAPTTEPTTETTKPTTAPTTEPTTETTKPTTEPTEESTEPEDDTLKALKNVHINEVSAEGSSDSKEGWAELYNDNDHAVELGEGVYLTDKAKKPEKFAFAGLTIPAKGFRIVYCDKGKGVDHASFSLDSDGELILNAKDGKGEIQNLDTLKYSGHNYNQTYGRKTDGDKTSVLFQDGGTFNKSNSTGQENYAIKVSHDRGLYDTGFSLTVSSKEGATIRYTTDGSDPSSTKGSVYKDPIKISESGIVKFYAYGKDGNSGVQPYTYVLRDNLKNEKYSENLGRDQWYYKDTITSEEYGKGMEQFPILSIAGDTAELTKREEYYQSTIEFLGKHVDEEDFISAGGAKKFGQASAGDYLAGVSMRFKRDYGSKKAKFKFFPVATPGDKYPVVKKFGKLQLKEGQDGPQYDLDNTGINRYSEKATMELAQSMGKFSLHTRYVHYFYNGKYRGIKTLREDFGSNSFEEYFGGNADDYTHISWQDEYFESGEVEEGNGDPALFAKIKSAAKSKDFQEFKKYVDIEDYIDTQILFMFTDTENEIEGILHNDAANNGKKMVSNINDTDGAFHNANKTGTDAVVFVEDGGGNYRGKWECDSRQGAGKMFAKFSGDSTSESAGNLEFKTLVKDQVLKQFGPVKGDSDSGKNAPLSVENVKSVLNSNIAELDDAYKLDVAFMTDTRNRYKMWKEYQTKILKQVDDRVEFSKESWLKYGMAHTLEPVSIEGQSGQITLDNPNATDVYYTTDGSDPMGADGKISSKAIKYTKGSSIEASGAVTARPYKLNNWGPMTTNK